MTARRVSVRADVIVCFAAVLAAIWSVLGVTVTNVRG